MEIEVSKAGHVARVALKGHVDERGAEALKSRLAETVSSSLKELVFDFKEVTRIGSAGIGQLLLAYKNLAIEGGAVRVENVSDHIYELFQGLKLDTLFTISR